MGKVVEPGQQMGESGRPRLDQKQTGRIHLSTVVISREHRNDIHCSMYMYLHMYNVCAESYGTERLTTP